MHIINATFEVVTPMFLGGADNKTTAELRAASIKGQLRFWWRALAWGRLQNLDKIGADEARIFGSADNGQGRFLLRVVDSKLYRQTGGLLTYGDPPQTVMPGARYLGYGLMKAFGNGAGTLERPCIRERSTFTVALHFSKPRKGKNAYETGALAKQSQQDYESVLQALELLGLLGGLGARVRRGWGSVALVELKGDRINPEWLPPENADEYGERIEHIVGVGASCVSPPEYSAFFDKTRVLVLDAAPTSLDALNQVGHKFHRFRSWRPLPGAIADRSFRADHDGKPSGNWHVPAGSFDGTYPAVALQYPLRVALGLPHNYSQHLKIEAEAQNRRASPLLFHIHPIGHEYAAVATVFPTRFLPDLIDQVTGAVRPEKIKIINGAGQKLVDNHVDYRIIDAFLEGFTTPAVPPATTGEARSYFPSKKAILP